LRPIVERNSTNCLSQAEAMRDHIHKLFVEAAARRKVDVLLLKSPPFTSPPWVKVECWMRNETDPTLTRRSSAVFTVRSREFHRFPTETDLVVANDRRTAKPTSIVEMDAGNAASILDFLLFERESTDFRLRRCRTNPFQLWRPLNRPVRLGTDPLAMWATWLSLIGFFTVQFFVGIPLLVIGIVMAVVAFRRPRQILSAGKPSQEPRRLIRLDSWQTIVRGVGAERDSVKNAVRTELSRFTGETFVVEPERIWYWGVDGIEEREQIVIRFRRGIAFVHVYQYGSDLYVGWDAHVNCGTWVEKVSASGYEKQSKQPCSVYTIEPGWHIPTEYDLTDANCLLERVHAAATKTVKHQLAIHHIDQEIDFKILREQRQSVVGRQDTEGGGVTGFFSRFRRVG
jgi:hypothetical protein